MPYHILLVDDDPYFRTEFQECMEEFNVTGAANAQEALRIFKQPHNIDLVILDEILPGVKGTDLLQQLKAIQPDINTILLTGHSTTDIAVKALRAQATDFIEKPLDAQKIEKIRSIVLASPGGERDRSLSGVQGKIERARYFAERNFNKKLKLKDVADEVCLSTKYLSRIFKENTGMSFSEYKLKLRIEQAKKLLVETGDSIEEISYRLGYQNPESFIKIFRNATQHTPRRYRELMAQTKETHPERRIEFRRRKTDRLKTQSEAKEKKQLSEDLRKTKEELVHEKTLSELGPTASILVHELRQPLSIIQIATWNIKKKSTDGRFDHNIQSIERMIEQCDYILKNFLNFTHIRMPEFQKSSIKKLVLEAIDQSKAPFNGTPVKVTAELAAVGRETIETDPRQFKDVLANIITNAFEALGENKKGKILVRAARDKSFLTLKITDNGRGMSAAHLKRIGTPFFTLKPEGSGLGLAISQEIVNLHGGHMDINSKLAKGTSVSIRLPLRRERKVVE